ncbi:MAG TPA: ATP-binding protein [Mariprofundaceae bacterium]|nr:ATP-binding protein [Mariprofundaceae bacterium]
MPIRIPGDGLLTDAPTLSRNLRRLLQVRSALILCQAALLLSALLLPGLQLEVWTMSGAIAVYALVHVASIAMFRGQDEISERAYFGQLLLDVAFLTLLLYFSGGYTNPFISLYLLPLFIAASTLPGRYAWSMAGLVLACYSLLVFFYRPLFSMQHGHADAGFHLHLVGMWFSFVLSVALIVFFIMRMSDALREREKRLADMREKATRDELVVALGALAAGAAHELGTPLSTMAVIAGELARDHAGDRQSAGRIEILREQIRRCRHILSQISASAGQSRAEGGRGLAVDAYIREVLAQWRSMRPEASVSVDMQSGEAPALVADVTLTQAIINLLDNAADASPALIGLSCRWRDGHIEIEVCDEGQGLPPDLQQKIGSPFVSTKSGGRGLGLFLSRAVVERLGGNLTLSERQPHGVCARLTLPYARFLAGAG